MSKDLTNMEKLDFVRRKVEFMQEFGDVGRYRDAWDQLKAYRHLCSADLKVRSDCIFIFGYTVNKISEF